MDGFKNARVGVEPAEVIDIVGSRELVVTISDKFVKIGGLFCGERESDVAEVVEVCKGVNRRKGERRRETATGMVGLEREKEFVQHFRKKE